MPVSAFRSPQQAASGLTDAVEDGDDGKEWDVLGWLGQLKAASLSPSRTEDLRSGQPVEDLAQVVGRDAECGGHIRSSNGRKLIICS